MTESAPRGESLLAILEELHRLVNAARPVPMSAAVLVNKAEALDLLDAARAVVPDQIAEAEGIVSDAEEVVQRARENADRLIRAAEERARALIEEDALVEGARRRAAEIVADAEETARKLSNDANDYCDRQLSQLESEIAQISKQVQAGRTVIQARLTQEHT